MTTGFPRSSKGVELTTALIGVGNTGSALARHLVAGDEPVVLAAKDESHAEALAQQLAPLARASSVAYAIASAKVVVFAVWLDTITELIAKDGGLLDGKVIVDPSNPLGFNATGQMFRTLPDDQSAGSIGASLLPAGAHYVKALGTLSAETLAGNADRTPHRAVLFHATDDDEAAATAERLIRAAGFDPFKVGSVAAALRIEMPGGDLHQYGMNDELLDLDEARTAIDPKEVPA